MRLWVSIGVLITTAVATHAGTLVGTLALPQTAVPPQLTRAFLERSENPFAPVRAVDVERQIAIVVAGDSHSVTPTTVRWDLVGESFARPVIVVPVGADVVITNMSKTTRTLRVAEAPKLIANAAAPLGPGGTKSFRPLEPGKTYTIGDVDAPYLVGRVVVVDTSYVAYPDETGHFEIDNIPAGTYKVRIWYRDKWLDRPDDAVAVAPRGKTELNPKVAATAFAAAAPAK